MWRLDGLAGEVLNSLALFGFKFYWLSPEVIEPMNEGNTGCLEEDSLESRLKMLLAGCVHHSTDLWLQDMKPAS